ncbi:MAG: Rha family transcriptional regulator, partial [Gammaproteobacteria bacterium]|nr:Rha family transcriptional regulator [Gammaproteobacteria bacterium]
MNQEKIPTSLKPRLKVIDGEITTTSLDVAEKFGKNHFDVLKAIRNLGCSEEFAKSNFALVMETMTYRDSEGEMVTKETSRIDHIRMTKNGFSILAMGFTGKAAMKWKEAYINAFSFMETR